MTIEDRLHRALHRRASDVHPAPDGLDHIKEKLMDAQRTDDRNRMLIWLGSAAAVAAVVIAVVLVTRDDGGSTVEVADATTTTAEEPTSTPSSTTETTFAPTVDAAPAVFPDPTTSRRFDDPVAAASAFATDFLGFVDPVVGELQEGDSRSGEVPVRPTVDGPVTTVLVRQLEDDTWFVIAADTEDLTLAEPSAGDDIDCPLHVSGTALAFEGHVDVTVYADAIEEPIGTGFVTGSGSPPAGPFEGDIECDLSQLDDGTHRGTIVLSTAGGEDGRIWTAEVIRVQLR